MPLPEASAVVVPAPSEKEYPAVKPAAALVSSAVSAAGLGVGLFTAKLVAVGFGILLHLRRVHSLVALLTLIYLGIAILPWTALFLTQQR